MTIDEAAERAAFELWFASTYPTEDANDVWHGDVGPDMFIGWKARAAQPVTVTREALIRAVGEVSDRDDAMSAWGVAAVSIAVQAPHCLDPLCWRRTRHPSRLCWQHLNAMRRRPDGLSNLGAADSGSSEGNRLSREGVQSQCRCGQDDAATVRPKRRRDEVRLGHPARPSRSAIEVYDSLTAVDCERIASRFVTVMHDRVSGKRTRHEASRALLKLWLTTLGSSSPSSSPRRDPSAPRIGRGRPRNPPVSPESRPE